jgi:hypothetical protein
MRRGLGHERLDDLDLARFELPPEFRELLVFEVQLGRNRGERALVNWFAALLSFVEKRENGWFENRVQFSSLPSFESVRGWDEGRACSCLPPPPHIDENARRTGGIPAPKG